MRHQKRGKKFHRIRGKRRAFLRNLANGLIKAEHVETTETRAKALRPLIERLITFAKRHDLASRRVVLSRLHDKNMVKKLFEEIGPRYQGRSGGYVRIMKLSKSRKRDGTRLAVIEFV